MQDSKIIKWIIILPIFGVILTSFILTNLFISSKYEAHETEIENLKKKHIENLKNKIQERIEHLATMLESSYNSQLENSKYDVKDMVYMGYGMLENIYTQNKELSKEKLFKKINNKMQNVRFFNNNSGYYFIFELKEGRAISFPSNSRLVGKFLTNVTDKNGKNLFRTHKKLVNTYNEGFDVWYWNKPNQKEPLEKVGYLKKFSPLNIAIGTAVYTEDIKKNIANDSINSIKSLEFSDNSYIFVIDKKGTSLHHKESSIVNVPLHKLDKKIQKNVRNIMQEAKNSNGAFIEYLQSEKLFSKNSIPSKKISYIKYIPTLEWVIGTGLYTKELNEEIKNNKHLMTQKLAEEVTVIVIISLLVSLFIIIFLIIISKKINNRFDFYANQLEQNNENLKSLNNALEEKVKTQVKKIRQKDLILNQQSKLTAMGEMLGNISHQWRQPLSAISTLASGIMIQKEMGLMKEEQLNKDLTNIVESTQVLSHTIDDFRNFYSNKKQVTHFKINQVLDNVLNLVSATVKNHEIKVIINTNSIEMSTYKNELIQVLLNIINNAKDALKDVEHNKYLFINTHTQDEKLIIEIYDNAKGIKEDIMESIFDPYFTTKADQEGTGIGLYMSKNILNHSLKGEIKVENKNFEYENHSFRGALFTITLPVHL